MNSNYLQQALNGIKTQFSQTVRKLEKLHLQKVNTLS
jgi:hypothetical protein